MKVVAEKFASLAKKRSKAAKGLRRRHEGLAEGVPRLKVVRLLPDDPMGYKETLRLGLADNHFAVLGEVANINHYILLNIRTGIVLEGIFHLDSFEEVPEDDL